MTPTKPNRTKDSTAADSVMTPPDMAKLLVNYFKPSGIILEPKIVEFLVQSNAIEGVYDKDSLDQSLYAWEYLSNLKVLTKQAVLRTHKILMLHQKLYPNEKGYFRTVAVYVGNKDCMHALKINEEIDQWLVNVNDLVQYKKESQTFLEKMTKEHHVKYEKIHPFVDGNGRTGRMFMNWERLQLGLPLLTIHEGEEQMEYYKWFK